MFLKFIPSDSEEDKGAKGEITVLPTEEELMAMETKPDEDLTYS